MKTPYLQPLEPYPIHINENRIIGQLKFEYNSNDNYMVISFFYEKNDQKPVKLKIQVEVSKNNYTHYLSICDYSKRIVKTAMFIPEYDVWDGIHICSISPLIF